MAYNATSPNRIGENAYTATDANELFLKVFSGEVLTTFEETNLMMGLHRVRTISSGKTAQFPVTGVASAKYHTPGESVLVDNAAYLSSINHGEVTISIDGILQSSAFVADIDEAKNHYDVRSIYSTEIGRALAYSADKACIRSVIAGARTVKDRFGTTASTSTDVANSKYLGAVINIDGDAAATATHINSDGQYGVTLDQENEGQQIYAGIFKAANLMDSKNVSRDNRFCILSPDDYYLLLTENRDAISRDYNPEGNGSFSGGEIVSIAGIRILKSTHVPSGDESSSQDSVLGDNAINNDVFVADGGYSGVNFTGTRGIVFQSEAIGTVKLMDLAMESEYFMERMGTLLLAKYAMGHGVLRPEACYELVDTGS
tara:strand:- start:762 stop:1880 length:1119 start_codon:yes stop_codon:yes gene_type:complete